MSNITISIDLENDSFRGDPAKEVRRILTELLVEMKQTSIGKLHHKALMDYNGNTVGRVKVLA